MNKLHDIFILKNLYSTKLLKVKKKTHKIQTIWDADSSVVSERKRAWRTECEEGKEEGVGHTSVSEFYVDVCLWSQVYWPDHLTLSSAQSRWPERMTNRSSFASSTDLTQYHPLQLSAKWAHSVSKSPCSWHMAQGSVSSFETISSGLEMF